MLFGIFGKAPFWIFPKRLLEGIGEQASSSWGTPQGWPAKEVGHHGAPHGTPIWHIPFMKGIFQGHFGVFCMTTLPLGFPINRGGEAAPNLILALIHMP